MVTGNLLTFVAVTSMTITLICLFVGHVGGSSTKPSATRSDLLSSNSLVAARRNGKSPLDVLKKRQNDDKYFFNSVMERRRQQEQQRRPTAALCKNFPGLSKRQLELCFRYPDVMTAAVQGLQLAVSECQFQFQKHRWNCSALERKNRNPHASAFLQKEKHEEHPVRPVASPERVESIDHFRVPTRPTSPGYRETAFAYAVSSAGVAHTVSKACAQGKLDSCGCDSKSNRHHSGGNYKDSTASDWRWSGCSHNMDFGFKFSRFLLDSKQRGLDIHSRIHLHNSDVGRSVVGSNMEVRCKCHGMSGSCEMKTCWKAAPDFRRVGTVLKERFDQAVLIDQTNDSGGYYSNRAGRNNNNRQFARRLRDAELLFYERSPNYCEERPDVDYPGITGRRCNRTGTEMDNCQSLCCGRGYNIVRQKRTERCHCRFQWCCQVQCQNCTTEQWVTVCK